MTNEEAIDNLQDLWNEVYNEDSDGYNYAEAIDMAIEALSADGVGRYENAMQKLREMPKYLNGVKEKQIKKISANEVVRCKDCKHLEVINTENTYAICHEHDIIFEPFEDDTRTHFCSWGERREP